jgi:hypothetical protein
VGNDTNLGVTWFPKKRNDGFFADPFVAEIDGGKYIFAENYSYEREKGVISYIKYPDDFKNGEFQHAYEEDTHMSYPYMFKYNDNLYCIPETHEDENVNLYRVKTPEDWVKETKLIQDIKAIEPTIIRHNRKLWLFFTKEGYLRDKENYKSEKLYIYHSPKLFGEWKPHDNNPVKTDIRSSRPAGKPFKRGGNIFRPSQYCATGYGKKIIINKIKTLQADLYEEQIVGEIKPTEPYPKGSHHVSSNGELTVIDGKRHIWTKELLKRKKDLLF